MRRVFPRLTLGILASALLWSLLPLPGAGAEPDLRVIVTSIDGIRNSEGFGDPDCQDGVGNPPPPAEPTCLIPKLEALFRAPPSDGGTLLGTLYTGATAEIPTTEGSAFVNNAATWTTPGHTMLLTGVRDVEPNRGPVDGPQLDIRPLRPTVFERLRKQLGWANDDAAAVVSKDNLARLDYSADPAHGQAYGAKLYPTLARHPDGGEDREVADGGLCLMRGTRPQYDPTNQHIVGCGASANPPRLLFLHFGAVDFRGHACPTGPTCGDGGITYQEAIQQVDAQIHDKIWAEIARGQNPEFTTANTVVLITTDHGRESFSAQDHGGLDWANRAIFLFGRGPGIPGQLFTDRPTALPGELGCQRKIPVAAAFFPCRQQEDLAPTVASLFGVAMPDSEGVVMAELLGGSPPAFPAQPSEPRVQAGGQGSLHVVWTERDTTTGDRVVRYLRQDPPLPTSFTLAPGAGTPISVTADAEGRRLTATQPYLFVRNASGQDRVLVAYSVTRSVQDSRIISGTGVGGDNVADVYLSSSTDGGATWTKERVAQSVLETEVSPTPVMYLAPATVAEVSAPVVRRWVFASRPAAVLGFSRDGTDPANPPVTIATSPNCPETLEALEDPPDQCPSEAFFPQRLDAAMQASGNRIELVWQTVSPDARWDVYRSTKLTFDGSWSAPAAVTGTTDQLTGHLPAVTLQGTTRNVLWAEDQGSVWRVRGSRASSAISGDNAFLPDAVASSASNMYAAYSRVNPATGDYDIYRNRSTNGGQIWLGEVELTPPGTPDPSLFPSVTWDAQGTSVWAVWREGSSPTWQIKGQLVFTEV